jgi:hypothetical protein
MEDRPSEVYTIRHRISQAGVGEIGEAKASQREIGVSDRGADEISTRENSSRKISATQIGKLEKGGRADRICKNRIRQIGFNEI